MTTNYVFKIIVVGDGQVGKTSIVKKYVHDSFSNAYKATIGADFGVKLLQFPNEKMTVYLQLWDIQGQDRNRIIVRPFYKDALGAIVVYDVTKEQSFRSAHLWKKEIDQFVEDEWRRERDSDSDEMEEMPNFPTLLLGNKSDLERCDPLKSIDMKNICSTYGYFNHIEVSAKTGKNIDSAMLEIVRKVIEERRDELNVETTTNDKFQIDSNDEKIKQEDDGRKCFSSMQSERIRLSSTSESEPQLIGGFHLHNPTIEEPKTPNEPPRRCCT